MFVWYNSFEGSKDKNMTNKDINNYIEESLKVGISEEEIENNLLKDGLGKEKIKELILYIKKQNNNKNSNFWPWFFNTQRIIIYVFIIVIIFYWINSNPGGYCNFGGLDNGYNCDRLILRMFIIPVIIPILIFIDSLCSFIVWFSKKRGKYNKNNNTSMNKKIFIGILLIMITAGVIFWLYNNKPSPVVVPPIIVNNEFKITDNEIVEEDAQKIIAVSYPSVGIKEIDDDIKSFVDEEVKSFKEIEYVPVGGGDVKYYLYIEYFSTMFNKDIVSFKFNISNYTGGAHGNENVVSFTYNIKEKKKMELSSFFNSESYLQKISDLAIEDLLKDPYAEESWIREGAGANIDNYSSFIVTENAFIFYFPPYQVAPYAGGEKQVIILFSNLKDILNPTIFGNFDFSINKGIYVLSPAKNEKIGTSAILSGDNNYFIRIEGYLNGNGWAPFEAVGGRVELLDENNNVLTSSSLEIPGDWMKIPVYFRAYLFFNPGSSKTGTLVFHNDNASGLEENNREFSLPINFK